MWVALSYVPIEVEIEDDGSLRTYTTELSDEIAKEESLLGCWHCFEPLTIDNVHDECPGKSITGP
jgi:hypothetical protein